MKYLAFLALVVSCGCGGVTSQPVGNPVGPTAVTMQQGQWELVATPSSGLAPIYVEANFTVSNGDVNATVFNTSLFQNVGVIGGLFSDCANFEITGSESNGTFQGGLGSPGATSTAGSFSGAAISSNGGSVSAGSYSANTDACGFELGQTGTLTGYTVAPLNGTFSGTLTGTGQDQVSIQISQDSNFGITATGTSLEAAVTTSLSISPQGASTDNTGGYSNVIGATLQGSGTATNVNGSSAFSVFGHFNPTATQITIVVDGQSGTETGTLTKQ